MGVGLGRMNGRRRVGLRRLVARHGGEGLSADRRLSSHAVVRLLGARQSQSIWTEGGIPHVELEHASNARARIKGAAERRDDAYLTKRSRPRRCWCYTGWAEHRRKPFRPGLGDRCRARRRRTASDAGVGWALRRAGKCRNPGTVSPGDGADGVANADGVDGSDPPNAGGAGAATAAEHRGRARLDSAAT